ncbi:hypothetical protein N5079_04180 [Planotetraspora sp. A-T 1434]|uniref:hypothetical protein n=1 Tax=Planotetraspora sp. A-T 1434 TaxID=2979219 RepID=UPI0021C1D6DC|nr:hypothetical protein [Planotetraspora sp. A-T 1434]MCT9929412.1 hypothetical protein [Planotetraspora sp. A-T 1434]
MLVLPSPGRLRRTLAVLGLAALALAGCTSDKGPTAAQAGQTLKNHILQLLKERDAENVTITDPGGRNIPCADGKAKQTFSATGNDNFRKTAPHILRTAMLGALERVGNYDVVGVPEPNKPIHVTDVSSATNLVLDSPSVGVYSISGETRCLSVSR